MPKLTINVQTIPSLASLTTLETGAWMLKGGECLVVREKAFFQSYKNIYLTGFNQWTIAQIRIKLTVEDDIEICSK